MTDDYYIDLEKYLLNKFKKELKESELLPSRKMLKEHIDERFKILENNGVHNLQDLANSLKSPKKAKEFAKKASLPADYLLILRREVNSYIPKPVNLDKFPGIEKEITTKLNSIEIKNTAHLFKRIKTKKDRQELSDETGITNKKIIELTKLTDLSRVKWIGPVFARIFVDSKADTLEKLSNADAEILYKELVEINNEKGYTKAKFVENDVKLCITVSKMVPNVIE
jgi:hypothetical protein